MAFDDPKPPWMRDTSQPYYYTHVADRRFELVKIAFKEALVNQANPNRHTREATAEMVATDVVGFADKVIAEMEKEPETHERNANADAEQGE